MATSRFGTIKTFIIKDIIKAHDGTIDAVTLSLTDEILLLLMEMIRRNLLLSTMLEPQLTAFLLTTSATGLQFELKLDI